MKKRQSLFNKKILIISVIFLTIFIILFWLMDNFVIKPGIKEELYSMRIKSMIDKDNDGIDDYTDILENARKQIGVVTSYDTSYYRGGYPPDDTGACADVPWRALKESGYDFKKLIDNDMKQNPELYPTDFDSNINFRRTQNIRVFLERNAQSLTTKVIPGNIENLSMWQGGDIVTYEKMPGGLWHVAIVSDKRRDDGVPYIIHNYGQGTKENDYLLKWPTKITGHFRFNLD